MGKHRWWMLGLLAVLAAAPAARADTAKEAAARTHDVQALAARIDKYIADGWNAAHAEPAPPADDAEFLRRAYLDLAGRIPSVTEARTFLKDTRADKRERLVEKLLEGPRYVNHFTNVWRSLLLPEADTSFQVRFLVPTFETWVRKQLAKNAPYDQMVRELVTTPVGPDTMQGQFGERTQGGEATPVAFYLAKDIKPENVAAATSRLFLGVRLECAQCHNHPFAAWKREQFWGYTAFFAGLQRQAQGDFATAAREITDRREVSIPGTEKIVQAAFLDGSEPQWKYKVSSRATLADWMTSPKNPYFARAAVNRTWAYFFGTGLVDPVDEMIGGDSTCSHPELLDELAREFVAHQFDLKFLMRAITGSRAYQLSSAATHPSQAEPRLFAKMTVRGLTPEQLFDSVAQATGYQEGPPPDPRTQPFGNQNARAEFLAKFGRQADKPTETQTSILQALSLMNGQLIASATSLERSETLAAVADAPFLDTPGRVEALYLATLSRKPTSKELARVVRFIDEALVVENGQKEPTPAEVEKRSGHALADVFWVLLNSGEFILNH
jgi:hypothetical protein